MRSVALQTTLSAAAGSWRRLLPAGLALALIGGLMLSSCGGPTRRSSTRARRPAPAREESRPPESPGLLDAGSTGADSGSLTDRTPAIEPDERIAEPVRTPRNAQDVLKELDQLKLLEATEALEEERLGDEAFANNDHANAVAHYRKALNLNSNLTRAREQLGKSLMLLGRREGEVVVVPRELADERSAEGQQNLSDARRGLQEAIELLKESDVESVDAAERKLARLGDDLATRHYSEDVSAERAQVKDLLLEVKQRKVEVQRQARLDREAAVQKEKERLSRDEERQRVQRVDELTLKAAEYIRFQDYDKAIEACNEILRLDPSNRVAAFWLREARTSKLDHREANLIDEANEQERLDKQALATAGTPWSEAFVFPEEREWRRVQARKDRIEVILADDPEPIRRIKNILETTLITFEFQQKSLIDVLAFLRQVTGINIEIDPEVAADPPTVDLTVTDIKVSNALNLILLQTDLAYAFRENVFFITKKEKARGRSEFQVYNVSDILNKIRDFPGPELKLKPPGETDSGAEGGIQVADTDVESETALDDTALQDLIKQSTGGEEAWGGDQFSMEYHKGLLLVNAPIELHAEIQRVLTELREDSDIFVMIEARFIDITDDFLEDIGIDSRALGLVNNLGIPYGNIINDSRTGGNDLGFVKQGSPVRDVTLIMGQDRWGGRVQHIIDGFTGLVQGDRLRGGTGISGLTLQGTWLDPFQLNAILRAVQEKSDVRQLTAPTITAHNGERVYVSVITQRAYIADYELVSGGTGFSIIEVADPIVATFQEGVILDVDPVISHDKKYVTLDVRPTMATLIGGVISTILISLGSFTNVAFQVPIGVPEVSLQQTYTSVTVPNGGTVLLGGFKSISEAKYVSYLPVLGSVPLIKNLFRRKAVVSEKRSLVILITARIINPRDAEASKFSTN
jgi:type II secretory pathway component GspD/PulD (secretin)